MTRIQERGANGQLTGYHVDFQYNDTTGRLTKIVANDGREMNYGFDALLGATRGNLISATGLTNYSQTFANGTVQGTYVYNAIGEQVQRQTSVTTRFVYDETGQLIGQYDNAGVAIQQYLWLDGMSVGMIVSPTQATTANGTLKYV